MLGRGNAPGHVNTAKKLGMELESLGRSSSGTERGDPYTISAEEQPRSSLGAEEPREVQVANSSK